LLQVLAQRGIVADAVRFELGFGGSRSRRWAHDPDAAPSVPSKPETTSSSAVPRDPSARIDLYA